MLQNSESNLTDDEFSDALEKFIFSDSQHSPSLSTPSSVHDLDYVNHDSVSKIPESPEPESLPSSTGIRHRRIFSRQNSKELRFKNNSDCLTDFELHGSNVSPTKGFKFSLNLKDDHKLNDGRSIARIHVTSGETNRSTLTDDVSVDDRSVTINSPNTGSNFVFTLVRLIIKLISLKISLLVAVVTFPLWFTHSSYKFVTNPFAVMRRVKRYITRSISRFLKFCLGDIKRIVYKLIKRNKSVWKLGANVGRGLMCSVFVGLVLVCLLVFAFVIGGVVMRFIVEAPVSRIEQLNFDYTRDAPVAFVPVTSCSEFVCFECEEKIGFGSVGLSGMIPRDRKLQATVSLSLPESGYNRNLGNFQVRVDFLSSNGKSLATATQPCTMRFRSWPIRLLTTFFKLAPLITGYSSESQTVDIKFNGYTERETPTCCVRVALEPRVEFAKGGGVPEIYTAYIKLESQLPLLKRVLWSWKATVFVWTSIAIFKLVLVFVLLCCAPWLRLRGTLE